MKTISNLKTVSPQDRLLFEVLQLRKRLDLIIREYQASLPTKELKREAVPVIDPRTGKPFKANGGLNGKGKVYRR